MASGVRIRRNVYSLPTWDDTLLWCARAIAELQQRPLDDPTGWRYQAAIHDYDAELDELATPADTPPSQADQARYWRRCQHFTWFFLPWHRMYLLYFERIIAAAVVRLGGPPDWALP